MNLWTLFQVIWHVTFRKHTTRQSVGAPHCILTHCSCGKVWEEWS